LKSKNDKQGEKIAMEKYTHMQPQREVADYWTEPKHCH